MLQHLWRPIGNVTRSLSVAASSSVSVDKEALMKLRKRTGYSYVNCRKALVQFGPEKLEEAEHWLKELAKKEGWAKAAKLSSRSTSQGLVGFTSTGSTAAIVELQCETDFVARGENFKAVLEKLTRCAVDHVSQVAISSKGKNITKKDFGTAFFLIVDLLPDLETLMDAEGRSMKEMITMAVGKLGENISVKKIAGFVAPEGSSLFGAAHPKENDGLVPMGKFVSMIAIKRSNEQGLFPTDKLAGQICQHIIGMRSEVLGDPPVATKKIKEEEKVESEQDELNEFYQGKTTRIDEDETSLLRQSFMLNPSQTVFDYLRNHKAQVVDFVRYELGENV